MPPARATLSLSGWLLVALALFFALSGLTGHDPWKTEDAIGTGLVQQMLTQGQWLVPHLAGEPFLEDGPLHYWLASALAWATSPFLPLHDGARLASGVFILVALFLVRGATRLLYGESEGECALLALLGSLGLLVHAHENLGENALLASVALSLYAVALVQRRPWSGGLALGLAIAGAFLAKGLVAVLIPVITAGLVPLAAPWRTRSYALALALALAVAAAACGAWLVAAALKSPAALHAWLAFQLASISLPSPAALPDHISTLSWFAWPAWPIALWALWERRHRLLEPGTALALACLLAAVVPLVLLRDTRDVNALPMLIPLSLLAGAGVPLLRRGAANALTWFGTMTLSFLGLLVWLGWFAMMTGAPETVARNFAKLEPGYLPQFSWFGFLLATALTLAWIVLLWLGERSPRRSIASWSAGITMLWGLLMALWLPWIDYGKTYRPVAEALRRAAPPGARCIESRNLGEPQRAAFDYHAGVVTRRSELGGRSTCPVLLVQAAPGESERHIGPEWKRIWEGSRPRDKERFRMYVRRP